MFYSKFFVKTVLAGLGVLVCTGCGNRQGNAVAKGKPHGTVATNNPSPATQPVVASLPVCTFHCKTSPLQFDYPCNWVPDKAQTAVFAMAAPLGSAYSSLSLDIPKLPWHLPGMITLNMVASGYVDDLKKNQIHDAVVKEQCPLIVCGTPARRITSVGTEHGNPSIDVAVILIHADQVFILSADSDNAGLATARQTLDAALASWKWAK